MDIQFIPINLELLCFLKRFKSGPYLAWQLTPESKHQLLQASPIELQPLIKKFLLANGHITIVGNFKYQDRQSFKRKGSVQGILDAFPDLQTMINQQTEVKTHLAGLLLAYQKDLDDDKNDQQSDKKDQEEIIDNQPDLICGVIDLKKSDPSMIFRENLPQNKGISEDFYMGHSHITCYVNVKKGWKAKDSNLIINQYFDQQKNQDPKN